MCRIGGFHQTGIVVSLGRNIQLYSSTEYTDEPRTAGILINEDLIKNNLKGLVRDTVEETLNAMLDQEADELVKAQKYERSESRQGYRSGHYSRNLTTTSRDVRLHMPKLKGLRFETAIIERYKRRETSIEEALIEMYLAGVSVLIAIGIDRDGYRQIRHRRNVDVYGFSNRALEPASYEQRDGTRQPRD